MKPTHPPLESEQTCDCPNQQSMRDGKVQMSPEDKPRKAMQLLILGALTYHTKELTAMKPLYCGQAACCCQQSPAQALAICERRSFQMVPAPAIQVLLVEDPGIREPTHHAISKFLTCGTYPLKKKSGDCIISLSLVHNLYN